MLAGLLAATALLLGTPEPRGPERLAVLPVLLSAQDHASAKTVFDAVSQAAHLRPGLRVMSIDDYYFHEGQALAKRVLGCGADAGCMAQQLAPFDARLGLVIVVNGELSPPLVSVLLLDGERAAMAAQWAGQVEGRITEHIRAQVAEQLDAQGFTQSGRLVVDASPSQATLRVGDTAPDLGTGNTFTLPPGQYTVRGLAEGYLSGEQPAQVVAGEERRIQLELRPEPDSIWSSPWLWVGVGVVAAGAAATAVAVSAGGGDTCLCVQTRGMMDCGGCE